MHDHEFEKTLVNGTQQLNFADNFNVAVPFIDRHIAAGRGAKPAILTVDGRTESYAELQHAVNRAGNALGALGLSPGDRVLMVVKDCPAFFHIFWGAIKAGFVPVPINTLLRAKDYAFMIADSGCAALIYSMEFAAEVEPALTLASRRPAQALAMNGDSGSFDVAMAAAGADLRAAPARPEDDCFWLYSSGTTGSPKGTVHAHRDMAVTAENYAVEVLGITGDDLCFSAAKLFFAYGLGNAMSFPLWVGASVALLPGPPSPEAVFEMIERFKPSLFFGVPTLYAAQLRALESQDWDLSSIRLCVSAGEALPGDILRRWQAKTGTSILDGIGSTEALHIFISNRSDRIKAGTSGTPVPGYEAKIIAEDGSLCADGETGRLLIRGQSTARYYWNNPQKTAETMVDGWLDTGDSYFRDAEGYYQYCGRNDDMMKVGGIWCSPFEIEAKLIEHAAVLEAAVVGGVDEDDLVKPKAFIVLNDAAADQTALVTALTEHCKTGLARYKYPRWYEFVETLPKTATGKIQRFKLR